MPWGRKEIQEQQNSRKNQIRNKNKDRNKDRHIADKWNKTTTTTNQNKNPSGLCFLEYFCDTILFVKHPSIYTLSSHLSFSLSLSLSVCLSLSPIFIIGSYIHENWVAQKKHMQFFWSVSVNPFKRWITLSLIMPYVNKLLIAYFILYTLFFPLWKCLFHAIYYYNFLLPKLLPVPPPLPSQWEPIITFLFLVRKQIDIIGKMINEIK